MTKLWHMLPLEWRLIAQEYGALIVSGGVFILAALTNFILATPDKHTHAGYLPVQTISTFDNTTDSGVSIRAAVRLPDGTQTTISTGSLAAAQWFIANTCVEKRLRESGTAFYRLTAPSNCFS